jgi:hypothetical protein
VWDTYSAFLFKEEKVDELSPPKTRKRRSTNSEELLIRPVLQNEQGITTVICVAILKGHTGPVSCLEVFKDMIITGSADKCIKVWPKKTAWLNMEVSTLYNEF